MVWPSRFRRADENSRSCWGYSFQLTDKHPTPEKMRPLKYSYDDLGEEALKRLDAISGHLNSLTAPKLPGGLKGSQGDRSAPHQSVEANSNAKAKRDLYVLLRENADNDAVLGELWAEVQTVPHWVDWVQVARGQDVFYRYGGPAFTGLAYQSLLGGMVRIPNHLTSI